MEKHSYNIVGNQEIGFRYSFICQSTGRGNPVKRLAQGHNKQTCRPISTL